MITTINGFLGDAEIEVTPPIIDGNAVQAFTRGQCHALALALHELTGYEVVGLCWDSIEAEWPNEDGEYEIEGEAPNHVALRAPSGDVLDVEGWGAERRWAERWGTPDTRPVDVNELVERDWYRVPDLACARLFAQAVLDEYGEYA